MRKQVLIAGLAVFLFFQLQGLAQLTTPIDSGVAIGHIHLLARDREAMKRVFIEAFGAQVTKSGTLELLRLPGVFIIINSMEPSAGSAGSSADHLGFSVKDINDVRTKLAALNIQTQGSFVEAPDGLRLELLEDKTQTLPVLMHHIHLTAYNVEILRQWYVKTFGAGVGSRRNLPAAAFNGNEVQFLPANAGSSAPAPTKGRVIDHIGFEVKNLEIFMKKLQAQGVTVEIPYRDMPNLGLKVGFIVDPVGTRIELTEGLAGK